MATSQPSSQNELCISHDLWCVKPVWAAPQGVGDLCQACMALIKVTLAPIKATLMPGQG